MCIVSNNSSELWEKFLGSIYRKIVVNFSTDFILDTILNSLNKCWKNSALNKWNEYTCNLGNKSTSKFNINILWVDGNVSLLDCKFWGNFI